MDLIKLSKLNVMRKNLEDYRIDLLRLEDKYKFNKALYNDLLELVEELEINEENSQLIKDLNEVRLANKKASKDIKLLKRKIHFYFFNVESLKEKIEKERRIKKLKSYSNRGLYIEE